MASSLTHTWECAEEDREAEGEETGEEEEACGSAVRAAAGWLRGNSPCGGGWEWAAKLESSCQISASIRLWASSTWGPGGGGQERNREGQKGPHEALPSTRPCQAQPATCFQAICSQVPMPDALTLVSTALLLPSS